MRLILPVVFLLWLAGTAGSLAAQIPDRLRMDGFFRVRHWGIGSDTAIPGNLPRPDKAVYIPYEDFFWRNRIVYQAESDIELVLVLDISQRFGSEDFAIGGSRANVITRNAFLRRRTGKDRLEIGFLPFLIHDGFLLAREAAGVQHFHQFSPLLDTRLALVRAVDQARDNFNGEFQPPVYADEIILIAGLSGRGLHRFAYDTYLVYMNDRFRDSADLRKGDLFWWGYRQEAVFRENWHGYLHTIGNAGRIDLPESQRQILAGLIATEFAYVNSRRRIYLHLEGASGRPDDRYDRNSFQTIRPSREFSNTLIDNTGGVSVRGAEWAGLMAAGPGYREVFGDWMVTIRIYQFLTSRGLPVATEFNLNTEWRPRTSIQFLAEFAWLAADSGYRKISGTTGGSIIEIMMGMRYNY